MRRIKELEPYSDNNNLNSVELPEENNHVNAKGTAVFEQLINDCMINSELNMPQEEDMCHVKVASCSKDA